MTPIECESQYGAEQSARGQGWNRHARCILRASNNAEVDACYAMVPALTAPPLTNEERIEFLELRICRHLLTMIANEAITQTDKPLELTLKEEKSLLVDCLLTVSLQRPENGDLSNHEDRLDCLMQSRNTVEFASCN